MYEKRKDYLIDEALALKTYKITFVDVLDNGTAGLATVRAENQAEAEKKFKAQNDGCAIIIIKEQR